MTDINKILVSVHPSELLSILRGLYHLIHSCPKVDIQSLLYSSCTNSSVADFQTSLAKKYCFKMIQCHGGLAELYIKDMECRQQVQVTVVMFRVYVMFIITCNKST